VLGNSTTKIIWELGVSLIPFQRGPPGSSIRPEVIAAAVWPPGAEVVVVATAGAGDGAPFVGLLLLRSPPPHRVGLFVPAEVELEFRL
jgi:sugar/nucleoside kinase (ribokinase family)